MMERLYMFAVGVSVLTGLYFDLRGLVYGLIALMAFEGLTNLRADHKLPRWSYACRAATWWPASLRLTTMPSARPSDFACITPISTTSWFSSATGC